MRLFEIFSRLSSEVLVLTARDDCLFPSRSSFSRTRTICPRCVVAFTLQSSLDQVYWRKDHLRGWLCFHSSCAEIHDWFSQPPKLVFSQPPKLVFSQPPKLVFSQPPKLVLSQSPKLVFNQPPKPVLSQPPKLVSSHHHGQHYHPCAEPLASSQTHYLGLFRAPAGHCTNKWDIQLN